MFHVGLAWFKVFRSPCKHSLWWDWTTSQEGVFLPVFCCVVTTVQIAHVTRCFWHDKRRVSSHAHWLIWLITARHVFGSSHPHNQTCSSSLAYIEKCCHGSSAGVMCFCIFVIFSKFIECQAWNFMDPGNFIKSINTVPEYVKGRDTQPISDDMELRFATDFWAGWWFGCHFLFSHILGIIIPIDFHIFQRGGPTTNQWVLTPGNPIPSGDELRGVRWRSSRSKLSASRAYRCEKKIALVSSRCNCLSRCSLFIFFSFGKSVNWV